ncbi:MFS transport protein AraJ [Salmonella enterica subsp. enterica]|nr:MFS transport protein AraJ [Salmonella enterica subsp. enterica]
MTVANLVGIPFGTYLSQEFSWRYTFLLIAGFQHRRAHRNFLLGAGYP